MRYRTGLILLIGFGLLVVLVGALGLSALRRAERILKEVFNIHEAYRKSASILSDIESNTYLSGILVRDYLLDPLPTAGPLYRKELLEIRSLTSKRLADLGALIGYEQSSAVERLEGELDTYWDSLDPIFEWTPDERAALRFSFLRQQVLPRRNAIIDMMREMDRLNATTLRKEEEKLRQSRGGYRIYLVRMISIALSVALLVAIASILRISRLERHSYEQRMRTERAEQELRRLSQKLLQTQEQERKSISRELHDEIGQALTAFRMELSNLEHLRTASPEEFMAHLAEAKSLSERALRSVRDLAMGLRPSMLDDLGLGPALEWQTREFSRRSGIPVTFQADGELDNLPENLRTCVYRIVQESLTNCARHAKADDVRISIHGSRDCISLTIQDNGVGFDPELLTGGGLGLIGMQERVKELGGTMSVFSQLQKGTLLEVSIPLIQEIAP